MVKGPSRKIRFLGAGAILGLLIGGAGFLSVVEVLGLRPPPANSDQATYFEAESGTVEQSLTLYASGEWVPSGFGINRASGIVTSVDITPGSSVSAGQKLYSVDLRPVVLAQGSIPAFRSLSRGAIGPDVAELQGLLTRLGLYRPSPSGVFDSATTSAVKVWQRSEGIPTDGVVQVGDVTFVPNVPIFAALDPSVISIGATLAGGEKVLQDLGTTPKFFLNVTDGQRAEIPKKAPISIASPKGETWEGIVGDVVSPPVSSSDATQSATSGTTLEVEPSVSDTVCGTSCSEVPLGQVLALQSKITIVPATRGVVIPSSAIESLPSGDLVVFTRAGRRIPVTTQASANGSTVVNGLKEGTWIRVPAAGR